MEGKAYTAFFFALIAVWLTAFAAVASPIPPQVQSCPVKLDQIRYSALTQWGAYRIRVGRATNAEPEGIHKLVAELTTAQGDCVAVCRVTEFERSNHKAPIAMDLECPETTFARGADKVSWTRGKVVGTHLAILWKTHLSPAPVLRFGNWLRGYHNMSLLVKTDRFSEPERPRTDGRTLATQL